MGKNSMRKAVILTLLLIILVGVGFYFFKPHAPLPKSVEIDTSNQPSLGKENAKIHIVAFEDLKCGNCMRYSTTIFPTIKKELIDTGKANYTLINLAFIPGSLPAANAARCVYQQNPASFFDFVDYIYNHQPAESDDWATIPTLMQMASHIPSIDSNKLSECLVKSPNTEFINSNMKLAEKIMGASNVATPAIYVNGISVQPLTYARIKEIADAVK